jgi:uncharacterized integral membrane protein
LTKVPRSAGSVVRNIVAAVILVPLAIVIIAFAVANRQIVTVSLDPFSAERPAASLTLPLFVLIIALLIFGVLIGGLASWWRHGGRRRTARRLEREVTALRAEVHHLKTGLRTPPPVPAAVDPPERLKLQPPLR